MSSPHPSLVGTTTDAKRLFDFTNTVFAHLQRADQRRWGYAYLLGLLTVPGKKSVQRLASAVTASPTAFQSLQQFVNSSPWEWQPVRQELARWTGARLSPTVWTVASTVTPKRGEHSCGVHRRFVPRLGQHVNCQMAVGLFLSNGSTAVPVDWRLHLPDRWMDPHLRRRTRIPHDARALPAWADAFEMADRLRRCPGVAPAPLVADMSDSGSTMDLARVLSRQRNEFVVAVPSALPVTTVGPPGRKPVRPPATNGDRTLVLPPPARAELDARGALRQRQREGGGLDCLVRLSAAGTRGQGVHRLFIDQRRPHRFWLTNMVHHRVGELSLMTEHLSSATAAVHELEQDLGLLDFEGRSYPGWHHYMTLVSAAHAYRRLGGRPLSSHRVLHSMPA
ncbi:IS701 family transposase [Streptomyces beigongshangae]|uniref:IS701 family transposase n=1 Tax=Streptomyces beigongshangae TaxID=2841597 RepID=UPI001C84219A|nr:transposase [Streptomyces sp. REN17]